MNMVKNLLYCLLFVVVAAASKVRYDNHQVIRLFPEHEFQLDYLRNLYDHPQGLDFWTSPKKQHRFVDIRVPSEKLHFFHETVGKFNMKNKTMIQNLQEDIEESEKLTKARASKAGYDWESYYDLNELYEWMTHLTVQYPGIVSHIEGGRTYEGREILGVKLSYKEGNPIVFIESGIHAREWIAPATATCILNELITSTDSDVRFIAENFDWYIFPSVNPDGYQYSFTTGGASSNPCDETYAGPEPFSTDEYKSLAVTIFASHPTVYFCLHSYSQLLMIPYGHYFQSADNYGELMDIGFKAAAALAERYGTQYEVGPIADVIYVATGGSMDWVKSELNVPYTFEWELRDTGRYGFLLPPDQIMPTCLETLDSMKTILNNVNATAFQK
ncbi:Zinc carboxypeptidase A 1 [Blattella germanica]|nr:Zinc carboxypeptidase A 1 [Blattella germanica]